MNNKFYRILSLILIIVISISNIVMSFAADSGAGRGSYVVPSGKVDPSKQPTVPSRLGGASLVTLNKPSSYSGDRLHYGSFIVANNETIANKIKNSYSFLYTNLNGNTFPYPKTQIIHDHVQISLFTEPSTFGVMNDDSVIVDPTFPQVSKAQGGKWTAEKAVDWALVPSKSNPEKSQLDEWLISIEEELALIPGIDDFVFSDDFRDGNFVLTAEPLYVIDNAPVPGSNSDGLGITVTLSAAQLGIYDMVRLKGTGGSVSPSSEWSMWKQGAKGVYSQRFIPSINTNLMTNAYLTLDSAKGDADFLNIGVAPNDKVWRAENLKTAGKAKNQGSPKTLVTHGGVWLANNKPKDIPDPQVAINRPKTDFQVEEPEVINFNEKTGEIELSVKGGYHPTNQEYEWKYPEVSVELNKLKVTTSKSIDSNGKTPNIPDGEDTIFKGDNYIETGDGTLDDLVKTAKLSTDAQNLYKESSSSQISASFANDDSIKINTNQSPDEFSKKLPDGNVEYPGLSKFLEEQILNGKTDEKSRSVAKEITNAVSGFILDNPTYTRAQLPPAESITYEDFRPDDRLKLEVFIYDDMGNYITHYEKHIADVAQDNNVTGSEPFEKYTPMNLVQNTGDKTIKFKLNPQKYKEANSLVITSRINWIDPKEQKSHYYKNDEYLKRSETLPNLADDGLGWTNNLRQTIVEIPKPNLVATSIIPTVDNDTEKLCIEAEGLIEKIDTSTITTTHTVAVYKMTSKGYELVKEHTEQLVNVKQGDVVKFNNGQPWCTGIDIPKASTQKYFVTYYINKPHTQPDNEESYWDNKVENTIEVSQGVNWTATDVIGKATNKTPNNSEYFEYDLTIDGTGVLSSLKQDGGKTSMNAVQDLYISFDTGSNKTWTKIASSETGKKFQGDTTHIKAKTKTPIKVEANKSKTIYLKYCVNEPKVNPKIETIDNDNCVTNTITLPGPIPDDQKIGFPSLSCTFTIGQSDTKFTATQAGVFREYRSIDEQYGRLVNVRYTGSESSRWRSCGICFGPWIDEYGEHIHNNHLNYGIDGAGQASGFNVTNTGNGVHDNLEQYHKGSTYYTTRYLTGNPPTKDPKDTIYKYQNKKTLDLNMSAQTIRYYEQRSQSVADCHCDDCECDPCECTSTEYWTVALAPMQEKEFVIRFDEEYTYDSQNSRTYSTEAQGTKYDKQITAGKGFQQTIRTRLITDYPGELKYNGGTVYSVATGKGAHNKGPYATVKLEATDRLDTQSISKIQSLGIRTTDSTNPEYHTKMERYAVFNMVKNKDAKGGIREAYTKVNYPDSYLTPKNNNPAPSKYLTDYVGLKTYSIINISNKTVLDNSSPEGQGLKFGICYKDNMIVLGNYHNDYWVKPVDRDELS